MICLSENDIIKHVGTYNSYIVAETLDMNETELKNTYHVGQILNLGATDGIVIRVCYFSFAEGAKALLHIRLLCEVNVKKTPSN